MWKMFVITEKWCQNLKTGEAVEYFQKMECINILILLWATGLNIVIIYITLYNPFIVLLMWKT